MVLYFINTNLPDARVRILRRILQYHVLNELFLPEKIAHHMLFLSYPFRNEKKLLSGFPNMCQNKI